MTLADGHFFLFRPGVFSFEKCFPKIKIVCWSWNLELKLTWIWRIGWWFFLFAFCFVLFLSFFLFCFSFLGEAPAAICHFFSPSVCLSVAHHISGTVHHLVIFFVKNVYDYDFAWFFFFFFFFDFSEILG